MSSKILYVEDDESLAFVTKDNLEIHKYQVTHISDGNKAIDAFKKQQYDLCILDIMLPNIDGFQIAREIRSLSQLTPIIFLSAKAQLDDKIAGLEIGADDYMTKPFSIKELVLRMEAILRRSNNKQQNESLKDLQLDAQNYTVTINENTSKLTARECELLQLFLNNQNQTLKRSDILLKIWGSDDFFLGRSLDVFISRLRKLLKQSAHLNIENVHGVGFRLKLK